MKIVVRNHLSLRHLIFAMFFFVFSTTPAKAQVPTIYLPYSPENITFTQLAVVWFGTVTTQSNYADLRLGYSNNLLRIDVAVVDRILYYQPRPTPDTLANYDAVTVYLETASNQRYKLVRQVNWWEADASYQAAYQYQDGNWLPLTAFFTSTSGWRGNALNDQTGDRGWTASLKIPFSSNLPKPVENGQWRMMVLLHDHDGNLPPITTPWPPGANSQDASTWATLIFKTTAETSPEAKNQQSLVLTQSSTFLVPDGEVGGHTTCGTGLDFWTEWGEKNYLGQKQINIQNQSDIADWPCFSKYYLSFSLSQIPKNKIITKANLVLYQFGNAGGGTYADPTASTIHSYLVNGDFSESTLTWNNAPLPILNGPATIVNPMSQTLVWPGIAWNWDVTRLIQTAYQHGQKANLALYSSDGDYHSGKYFSSADVDDWNYKARPRLEITYGDPVNATPSADFNLNGRVELFDWNLLLKNIFITSCSFDLTGDCDADFSDIIRFVGLFK